MALIPIDQIPQSFNLWDKLQHALAFVTLTVIGNIAYSKNTKRIYAALILYGVLIEVMQSTLTTTRIGEFSDLLADSFGIAIGAIIYFLFSKMKCKRILRCETKKN